MPSLKHPNNISPSGQAASGERFYGIFEPNNMSTQIIHSRGSLPLHIADFGDLPCEQGGLYVYDEAKGVVRKAKSIGENVMIHYSEYKLYDPRLAALRNFALWSQEESTITVQGPVLTLDGEIVNSLNRPITLYDDKTPFPRMYTPVLHDTFTTNTVIYYNDDFADFAAIAERIESESADAGSPSGMEEVWAMVAVGATTEIDVNGTPTTIPAPQFDGYFELTPDYPTNARIVFRAVKAYDLPDGQPGIRFEVWKA